MNKEHKLDASHPGVGKSKIMKKLWKAWARDNPISAEHEDGDTVRGYMTPAAVLAFMNEIAAKEQDQ